MIKFCELRHMDQKNHPSTTFSQTPPFSSASILFFSLLAASLISAVTLPSCSFSFPTLTSPSATAVLLAPITSSILSRSPMYRLTSFSLLSLSPTFSNAITFWRNRSWSENSLSIAARSARNRPSASLSVPRTSRSFFIGFSTWAGKLSSRGSPDSAMKNLSCKMPSATFASISRFRFLCTARAMLLWTPVARTPLFSKFSHRACARKSASALPASVSSTPATSSTVKLTVSCAAKRSENRTKDVVLFAIVTTAGPPSWEPLEASWSFTTPAVVSSEVWIMYPPSFALAV
mmetsp:Transcript_18297/g.45713  ORF Transcript_18297/g.45713 Transcript_18297/m.45713 type:complete len:290 (+) Transcript_18297:534-1403(+)